MNNTGWTCPRCTRVYAPSVTECGVCNAAQFVPMVPIPERDPPRLPIGPTPMLPRRPLTPRRDDINPWPWFKRPFIVWSAGDARPWPGALEES